LDAGEEREVPTVQLIEMKLEIEANVHGYAADRAALLW